MVASQFGPAAAGSNIVIGEREYSSNHFPWRLLADKGYEVRQVPFRNGGLEPVDVARSVDHGTELLAFSAVQSATGHRSDVRTLGEVAGAVDALVFVDASRLVGAGPVAKDLEHIDILATPDHKFLMHAGRGLGYCYLSPRAQDRFTPTNAGWKAGRVPFESFYGPTIDLSETASRFDSSLSWIAAMGNQGALSVFEDFKPESVYQRNRELAGLLHGSLAEIGWPPIELSEANRSNIISVPVSRADPSAAVAGLASRGIVCAERDGNLRLSVHLHNHEDDVSHLVEALS